MSKHTLILGVNRWILFLSKVRYLWLNEIPNTWPLIIRHLEEYCHLNCCKMKSWTLHSLGSTKCNTDSCSQLKNPCQCIDNIIRNDEGNFVYAKTQKIGKGSLITKKIFNAGSLYFFYGCEEHNVFNAKQECEGVSYI